MPFDSYPQLNMYLGNEMKELKVLYFELMHNVLIQNYSHSENFTWGFSFTEAGTITIVEC